MWQMKKKKGFKLWKGNLKSIREIVFTSNGDLIAIAMGSQLTYLDKHSGWYFSVLKYSGTNNIFFF